MTDLNNIKFNYLYRDGGNYKNFGSVILSNFNNVDITKVDHYIRHNLIDGEYFSAKNWNIPDLSFEIPNFDDHEFHEFENVEITNDNLHHMALEEFLLLIKVSIVSL